jgi:hypothetical protein
MRRVLSVYTRWFLDRIAAQSDTVAAAEMRPRRRPPAPANPLMYELFVTCIADRN